MWSSIATMQYMFCIKFYFFVQFGSDCVRFYHGFIVCSKFALVNFKIGKIISTTVVQLISILIIPYRK